MPSQDEQLHRIAMFFDRIKLESNICFPCKTELIYASISVFNNVRMPCQAMYCTLKQQRKWHAVILATTLNMELSS